MRGVFDILMPDITTRKEEKVSIKSIANVSRGIDVGDIGGKCQVGGRRCQSCGR